MLVQVQISELDFLYILRGCQNLESLVLAQMDLQWACKLISKKYDFMTETNLKNWKELTLTEINFQNIWNQHTTLFTL